MGHDPEDGGLERLLDERGQQLMRAAVALTGSRADGEDLLQAALERLVQNWRRVDTDPEGYLRRTLYNLAADGWRRRGRWRGRLAEFRAQAQAGQARPEASSEDVAAVDLRDALVRLLHQLPPRQRAVIVLRYWEQRTEAETAAMLGCSEGTVKSTASRDCGGCANWPARWLSRRLSQPRRRLSQPRRRRTRLPGRAGRLGGRRSTRHAGWAAAWHDTGRGKTMNGNVEELLREGLDRLTAHADVPAGIAHRAR